MCIIVYSCWKTKVCISLYSAEGSVIVQEQIVKEWRLLWHFVETIQEGKM